MELILADKAGKDICVLDCDFDIEIGGSNTFELTYPADGWNTNIGFGKRVYIQGTEYGGIIGDIETDTAKGQIFVRGKTWRGYLESKFGKGTYSGNVNTIISNLLGAYKPTFRVPSGSITTGSKTFSEYATIGTIINEICSPLGLRLDLEYVSGGYIKANAVQRREYTEVSQDSFLEFTTEEDRTGVNHLICTNGTTTTHLYADVNGNISSTQSLFGIDEITDVYEYSGGDLGDQGVQQLQGLVGQKTMKVDFASDKDIDLRIGDLVAGRDFITGVVLTKPITKKIIKRENNVTTIAYSVEDGEV